MATDWGSTYGADGSIHGVSEEYESANATIYIYAPDVYGNTRVLEQLRDTLRSQYASVHLVEDDDDRYNVIRVHYYSDEGDNIDANDVVEIVKDDFDRNAYCYNN